MNIVIIKKKEDIMKVGPKQAVNPDFLNLAGIVGRKVHSSPFGRMMCHSSQSKR